mmetsp:Transcript_12967/g.31236  ORF Transcript_12967/g.31236 Transcript_12967/m.31236 type:complete len:244 (-) Transcript_12967:353-1084(-)
MADALKTCWHIETDCKTILRDSKMGTAPLLASPSAVQSTNTVPRSTSKSPISNCTTDPRIDVTCPRRTILVTRRSSLTSARVTVAQRNAVGSTDLSSLSKRPMRSPLFMHSCNDATRLTLPTTSLTNCRMVSGWITSRINSQASRGMIQVMRIGSTRSNSHKTASTAVLPAPITTKRGLVVTTGSWFGGITTASSTVKGGGRANGTSTFMYVASTIFFRTFTSQDISSTKERNKKPSHSHIDK